MQRKPSSLAHNIRPPHERLLRALCTEPFALLRKTPDELLALFDLARVIATTASDTTTFLNRFNCIVRGVHAYEAAHGKAWLAQHATSCNDSNAHQRLLAHVGAFLDFCEDPTQPIATYIRLRDAVLRPLLMMHAAIDPQRAALAASARIRGRGTGAAWLKGHMESLCNRAACPYQDQSIHLSRDVAHEWSKWLGIEKDPSTGLADGCPRIAPCLDAPTRGCLANPDRLLRIAKLPTRPRLAYALDATLPRGLLLHMIPAKTLFHVSTHPTRLFRYLEQLSCAQTTLRRFFHVACDTCEESATEVPVIPSTSTSPPTSSKPTEYTHTPPPTPDTLPPTAANLSFWSTHAVSAHLTHRIQWTGWHVLNWFDLPRFRVWLTRTLQTIDLSTNVGAMVPSGYFWPELYGAFVQRDCTTVNAYIKAFAPPPEMNEDDAKRIGHTSWLRTVAVTCFQSHHRWDVIDQYATSTLQRVVQTALRDHRTSTGKTPLPLMKVIQQQLLFLETVYRSVAKSWAKALWENVGKQLRACVCEWQARDGEDGDGTAGTKPPVSNGLIQWANDWLWECAARAEGGDGPDDDDWFVWRVCTSSTDDQVNVLQDFRERVLPRAWAMATTCHSLSPRDTTTNSPYDTGPRAASCVRSFIESLLGHCFALPPYQMCARTHDGTRRAEHLLGEWFRLYDFAAHLRRTHASAHQPTCRLFSMHETALQSVLRPTRADRCRVRLHPLLATTYAATTTACTAHDPASSALERTFSLWGGQSVVTLALTPPSHSCSNDGRARRDTELPVIVRSAFFVAPHRYAHDDEACAICMEPLNNMPGLTDVEAPEDVRGVGSNDPSGFDDQRRHTHAQRTAACGTLPLADQLFTTLCTHARTGACGHTFHTACMRRWLHGSNDAVTRGCPMCRTPFRCHAMDRCPTHEPLETVVKADELSGSRESLSTSPPSPVLVHGNVLTMNLLLWCLTKRRLTVHALTELAIVGKTETHAPLSDAFAKIAHDVVISGLRLLIMEGWVRVRGCEEGRRVQPDTTSILAIDHPNTLVEWIGGGW